VGGREKGTNAKTMGVHCYFKLCIQISFFKEWQCEKPELKKILTDKAILLALRLQHQKLE
jgi:hypothetical protein